MGYSRTRAKGSVLGGNGEMKDGEGRMAPNEAGKVGSCLRPAAAW